MASITVNISNSKIPGLTSVKRKVIIDQHNKDYKNQTYALPCTIEHYDENYNKIDSIVDITKVITVDNIKRIWVRANGSFSYTYEDNTQEMGMYDYFQSIQKLYSDEMILSNQVLSLDSQNYFDGNP